MEASEKTRITGGKSRARVQNLRRSLIRNILIIALLFLALTGAYYFRALQFRTHFFPNTYINNTDVSLKTPQEAKELLENQLSGYRLSIRGRGDIQAFLWAEDVGLGYCFDQSIDILLREQNSLLWFSHLSKDTRFEIPSIARIDEEKFEAAFSGLPFFVPDRVVQPQNAFISPYREGEGFTILEEVPGNALSLPRTREMVQEAIIHLAYEVDLEKEDLYEKPAITKESSFLLSSVEEANRWIKAEIRYEKIPPLTGNRIQEWIVFTPEGPVLDEGALSAYVKEIAAAYDTVYLPKDLDTSYGTTVRIDGSSYGWKVNQQEETERLKELIVSGAAADRTPAFLKRAASFGEHDFGSTYVEVNLTSQRLHYYKDGHLVLETDFVSGNPSKGKETPPGIFTLTYKQTDAVLRGEDYEAPVSYWMPFNGDIGFHDASWRDRFGYDYYQDSGSRGCINMPFKAAKLLYETIEAGCPVICYYLPGTERKRTVSAGSGGRRASSSRSDARRTTVSPPAAQPPAQPTLSRTAEAAGIAETSRIATVESTTKALPVRQTTAEIGPGALPAPTVPGGPGYRGE